MALPVQSAADVRAAPIASSLEPLAALPTWLVSAAAPERVADALRRYIPAFAAGTLQLRRCTVDRLRLQGRSWEGLYELTVDGLPAPHTGEVTLAGTLLTPEEAEPEHGAPADAFGAQEWRGYLPDVRLSLWTYHQDEALATVPVLRDAAQARALLEAGIRTSTPRYRDLRLRSVVPTVLRYKPGSRCTVHYDLEYDPQSGARGPERVIAKTYSKDKGQNAFAAMHKLWASPLSTGTLVTIAEPLAYIAEQKVLVQGPVPGATDLKAEIRSALRANTPAALEHLHELIRKTAVGLAALHHSGARHGATVTWEDERAEIRAEITKITRAIPWFERATDPLLIRLEALAAETPAEAVVATHRSFRPQQVLVDEGRVGFIDFDGFCQAEPALDIALFRATIKELGINTAPSDKAKVFEYPSVAARTSRLRQLDAICDVFLAEYARHAPIVRQRVALWEALDLVTVVLRCWSKVKAHQLEHALVLLDAHLHTMELA